MQDAGINYEMLLRIFGIGATVLSILWASVKYMVRYYVSKSRDEERKRMSTIQDDTDTRLKELTDAVRHHTRVEHRALYSRLVGMESRLRVKESSSSDGIG